MRVEAFRPLAALALLLCGSALAGCATVPTTAGGDGVYAKPIGDAPVTTNPTPYSQALICLGGWADANRREAPRISVGRISDFTQKQDPDVGGPTLTQGASLMAISALAKAGARLVERFDTQVPDLELRYANSKLLSDSPDVRAGAAQPYRAILPGQVAGSSYVLIGGITELNYNIASAGGDASAGSRTTEGAKARFTQRSYVMNVGLDLRLVDTQTLEVVDVVSYQKQIVGTETSAGAFSFLGSTVADVSAGRGALEPVQLAVRALIERAVLEMMSGLYGAPGPEVCLDPASDPLRGRPVRMASR